MKAHLLSPDSDVDFTIVKMRWTYSVEGPPLTPRQQALIDDLELGTLFDAMAGGDPVIGEISKRLMLSEVEDPSEILYRQAVLGDCLAHPEVIRDMLAIAVEAIDTESRLWGGMSGRPETVLHRSVEALSNFVVYLKKLRHLADEQASVMTSEGFRALFAELSRELSDDYFRSVEDHLKRLELKDGVLLSARLGPALKGSDYVLRSPEASRLALKERIGLGPRTEYHWDLPPRDEAGGQAISDLADRGVNLVANAAAQSADHIKSFFAALWVELGFYAGCLNLYGALRAKAVTVAMPTPVAWRNAELSWSSLVDPCLALRSDSPVVANDSSDGRRRLVIITGANSGGKSTMLRSVGIAQLMMQAGMFVAASELRACVTSGVFSHFIREEDTTMTSGKFDEELQRMSLLADELRPHALVLFNESFSATNEREGSEIATQIVEALLDSDMSVCFVTHNFTFARHFYESRRDSSLFLRAEREADGQRPFRLIEAEPLPTSFGADIYSRLGGWGVE